MDSNKQIKIPGKIWDAVADVASIKAVQDANGSPSAITSLIEESVKTAAPLIVAAELERVASELLVDSECYSGTGGRACADWAAQLRQRAGKLRGETR
jgi:hypothetical protein